MQRAGRSFLKAGLGTGGRFALLGAVAACICLLQGCGGSSSNSSAASTPALQAIKISPTFPLLSLAGSRQLKATGVFSDGSQQDVTPSVTWSATSAPSPTSNIFVDANGMAKGIGLGPSTITATLGPVTGAFQILVSSNGFAANTMGILTVPFNKTAVDAAYVVHAPVAGQSVYTVQEVNLDADQFTGLLPVQVALIASIPMPAGFVPSATVAVDSGMLVAVISYSSPTVVIIDASNDPTDVTNNTIIGTFTSPVKKSVTFNGKTCMICAAVADPTSGRFLLSTAQGYYSMDPTTGAFTPLTFTPAAFPAPQFTLNPLATSPYIISPTYGQDPLFPSEVQILDLGSNTTTTYTNLGLTAPTGAAIDLALGFGAVIDATGNNQSLLTVTDPQNIAPTAFPNVTFCTGETGSFNMVSLGVGANANSTIIPHTLSLSQASGDCLGFEVWPSTTSVTPPFPALTPYYYGTLPATPDGKPFVNSGDPNAIATFNSTVDKKNYVILLDADQNWIAKVNPLTALAPYGVGALPTGTEMTPTPTSGLVAGVAGDPVVFLPTTGSVSLTANTINFGSQPVGTASLPSTITLTNTSTLNQLTIGQITIQGPNASDFTQVHDCQSVIAPKGTCTITVTFTPAAQGTRSGTLSITDDGGNSPQLVALSGTGS